MIIHVLSLTVFNIIHPWISQMYENTVEFFYNKLPSNLKTSESQNTLVKITSVFVTKYEKQNSATMKQHW